MLIYLKYLSEYWYNRIATSNTKNNFYLKHISLSYSLSVLQILLYLYIFIITITYFYIGSHLFTP